MVFTTAGFPRVFPEKRLELKTAKGQTKAEEEGPPEKLAENGGTEGAPRGDGPSLLREGPCSQGASWAVGGSGVPPYDF
jgi:hypothetical protein